MGSNNYRGEISYIADDVFINYSLNLPDKELASTSGYFMKDAGSNQLRYSYFTVQRGATSQPTQTTIVNEIDRTTGNKTDNVLATIQWSSGGSIDTCMGLITGYDPLSPLPAGWVPLESPYYPCYVSMASPSKPGIDKDPDTGKMELHMNRIPELSAAILTVYLPALPKDVSANDLKLFLYRHQHMHSGASSVPPPPENVKDELGLTVLLDGNTIVIGSDHESLPMGLYVVARFDPAAAANATTSTQPVYPNMQTKTMAEAV